MLRILFKSGVLLFALLLSQPLTAGGPTTFTNTSTVTPTPTFSFTFTPLPTPNGLHVSGACNINLVAGLDGQPGYSGDGGSALAAKMNGPTYIAFDSLGNYYFCDTSNHLIRKVDLAGNISRYAGLLTAGVPTYGYNGDGIAATSAALYQPKGIAFDAADNLYIADSFNHRIRKVDRASGLISTVLGNGTGAFSGNGVGYASPLAYPESVVFDAFGGLYYTENTTRVRRAYGGSVVTVAGTTTPGYNGDGILATTAQLVVFCIALSPAGELYIADGWNDRIRKVNGAGMISTVFGNGVPGSAGVGGPATTTQLSETTGVGFDAYGDLYVSDQANLRVLKMDGTGNSSLVAGATGATSIQGNGGPAALAGTGVGYNFAFASNGKMYYSSSGCHVIRSVDACGGASPTPTRTPTATRSPSSTITPSPTRSATPSFSATRTATPSFSSTVTASSTLTPSPSRSATSTVSPAITFSSSATPSQTVTSGSSATSTRTVTPSPSFTATPSGSPSFSATATPTLASTGSATYSATVTGSSTASPSFTATPLSSDTDTQTATPVSSSTDTPTVALSPTFTSTNTVFVSGGTLTSTLTLTATHSATRTDTPTSTVTATATSTATPGPSTPTDATPIPTLNPAPQLLELALAPDPVQGLSATLAYRVTGRVTRVEARLYGSAYAIESRQELPAPSKEGWCQGSLNLDGFPNGIGFVRLTVKSEAGSSTRVAKFFIAR
jgi:hypothetical protein